MLLLALAGALTAAVPSPKPAPLTPYKTITNVHVSPLCNALRRSIAPAIGHILANDRVIAASRPDFDAYVKDTTQSIQAAQDLDVLRLERLIAPLVANSKAVRQLLDDPQAFSNAVHDPSYQHVLQMRAYLQSALAEQQRALDVISGFVDTEQMGELQQAGKHYYDLAARGDLAGQNAPTPAPAGPQAEPNAVLNAGMPDPQRSTDPRYFNADSPFQNNPLNGFSLAIAAYQAQIAVPEQKAATIVFASVRQCGGRAAPQPTR
jgi:hypothetical protein